MKERKRTQQAKKKATNNKIKKREKQLDIDLRDTFPASDPITKY